MPMETQKIFLFCIIIITASGKKRNKIQNMILILKENFHLIFFILAAFISGWLIYQMKRVLNLIWTYTHTAHFFRFSNLGGKREKTFFLLSKGP